MFPPSFFCHVPYNKLGRLFSQGEAIISVALGQSYIDNNQSTTDFPKISYYQADWLISKCSFIWLVTNRAWKNGTWRSSEVSWSTQGSSEAPPEDLRMSIRQTTESFLIRNGKLTLLTMLRILENSLRNRALGSPTQLSWKYKDMALIDPLQCRNLNGSTWTWEGLTNVSRRLQEYYTCSEVQSLDKGQTGSGPIIRYNRY